MQCNAIVTIPSLEIARQNRCLFDVQITMTSMEDFVLMDFEAVKAYLAVRGLSTAGKKKAE